MGHCGPHVRKCQTSAFGTSLRNYLCSFFITYPIIIIPEIFLVKC